MSDLGIRWLAFGLSVVLAFVMLFAAVGVIVKAAEFFGVRAVMVVSER